MDWPAEGAPAAASGRGPAGALVGAAAGARLVRRAPRCQNPPPHPLHAPCWAPGGTRTTVGTATCFLLYPRTAIANGREFDLQYGRVQVQFTTGGCYI